MNIQVIAVDQNMSGTRTSVTHGQDDIAWNLVLHVHVELLHHAGLEVGVLRLQRPRECRGFGLSVEDLEAIGQANS